MSYLLTQATAIAAASSPESNTTLYVLKYTGSVFAALYGLYATINDFHIHRHGKQVLSRKGYFGIGMLLVASVLSITADGYKDRREQKEKIEQNQKDTAARKVLDDQLRAEIAKTTDIANQLTLQQKSLSHAVTTLDQNAVTTRGVLNQTERILQPIKDLTVSYEILVPTDDPELRALLSGIKISGKPIRVGDGMICPSAVVNPPDSGKYPVAHDALDLLVLHVAFYREAIPAKKNLARLSTAFPPSYVFETLTHPGTLLGKGVHVIHYDAYGNLTLLVARAPLDSSGYEHHTFEMSSIPDLLKARVLVTVEPHIITPSRAWTIRQKVSISKLILQMYGEQQPFVFDAKNVKPIVNEDGYPVYYGKFSELFRQAPSPFGPKAKCD